MILPTSIFLGRYEKREKITPVSVFLGGVAQFRFKA
jgi:hypothetical protein